MRGTVESAVPLEDLLSQAKVIISVPPDAAEAHAKEAVRLFEVQETARSRCRNGMGGLLEAYTRHAAAKRLLRVCEEVLQGHCR